MRGRRVAVRDGRVRVPRRLDRAGGRRPAGRARSSGRPARACRCSPGRCQRRHPDAGGHAGVRADGADHPGGRRAQGGRAAVPRLPAAPHHRRRDGVVGLARARDRRGAGGAGRVPRARGSTRRCTASRSPRACRPRRTSTPTGSSTRVVAARRDRRHPRPRARHPAGARATASRRCPQPPARRRCPDVDTWDAVTRSRRRGPARRTPPAAVRRHRRRSRSTAPARASTTPGCCSRWCGSGDAPCVFLGQDRRGQTTDHPMGRRRCARPAAGCGSPRSSACRW